MTAPAQHALRLEGIAKRYDNGVQAVAPIQLQIAPGEFVSIVGPSGCGKSTLLRIIAGLEQASSGQCLRPAGQRPAFVFQEAALLPWRRALDNAALLLELKGLSRAQRLPQARQRMEQVGLGGFEHAYPHELSGGMRMRLSLARALALQPDLLLLDEPLAAVDELTRDSLQDLLSRLWQESGLTALLVTHNIVEALYLSSRVIVMSPRPGRILADIAVPFPFPRSPALRTSPELAQQAGTIAALLRTDQTLPAR